MEESADILPCASKEKEHMVVDSLIKEVSRI